MKCKKCREEMQYEDYIHRWNERTWYCDNCNYEETEDITGELIDAAKDRSDYNV